MIEIIYTIGLKLLYRFDLKYDNISRADIEDITSDTCTEKIPEKVEIIKCNKCNLDLFRSKTKTGEYKVIQNIESYVYKSIDNACKSHLSKKGNNNDPLTENDTNIPDDNLQEKITEEETINNLLLLIDDLSEKNQSFIRWTMMKHKTKEEIAKELGIKPHSVYKAVQRAKDKLKELYHKK